MGSGLPEADAGRAVLRTMLPFYAPVISVTAILALLFWFGVGEHERLRADHIERVLSAIEQSERQVADDMRIRLAHTESSLARYRGSLELSLNGLGDAQIAAEQARFSELTEALPDGTMRSRRAGFDGSREAGIWVPRGIDASPRYRAYVARAKVLTDQFGMGARDNLFADTWWLPAPGGEVIFGPTPDLAEFVFQAEAEYSYADTDWMRLARPDVNPDGRLRWTPLAFDPVPKAWMFSAVLPVQIDGTWWGSVGHDVPLEHLLRQVEILGHVEGSSFVLVTADDRLVASDHYAEEIIAKEGGLTLSELDEPLYAQAAAEIRAGFPRGSGGDIRLLTADKVAFISHIAGQDLLLINVVPLGPITGPVKESFNRLRNLALVALLLELAIASGVLWWNHRQARLSFSTLSAVHAELKTRDEHLSALNEQLELRVEQRTAELSAAKQRAEDALGELQRTQRQLIESEKMASLGHLVAGIAHEMNTPIGVAVTAASRLEEISKGTAGKIVDGKVSRGDIEGWRQSVEEGMRLILGSLGRAHQLIGSFKQIAVDQSSEQRRSFDLQELLHETQVALSPSLRRTSHVLEVDCPEHIQLDTYAGALFQLISNCVGNSLVHGFAGREDGRMTIRARAIDGEGDTDGDVELVYEDDGRGMSADIVERAFEPFFTTRRGSGGSGLGLHIVYNLITQLLGGSVELHSEPEQGMRLRVRIPKTAPKGQGARKAGY